MLYNDLREWIEKVDEFGELRRVEGVDWKYEMGAVTEVYARNPPYSAILFDNIKDYPEGLSRRTQGSCRRSSSVAQASMPDDLSAFGL